MTCGDAEKFIVQSLKETYDEQEAQQIGQLVIEKLTGLSRVDRIVHKDKLLTHDEKLRLVEYTNRLREHEPVQYILNEAWFFGSRYYVDKSVLVPRPETEELVRWLTDEAKAIDPAGRILDIGTGSGCIALAAKEILPAWEIWGCDISEPALNVARINSGRLNQQVELVVADILAVESQKQFPEFNIIVSNPPYIPIHQRASLDRNVVNFEPYEALFVPDEDPLMFYRAIGRFAHGRLHPDGLLFFEVNESFGKEVIDCLYELGFDSELKKDLQGKNRMVKASRPRSI